MKQTAPNKTLTNRQKWMQQLDAVLRHQAGPAPKAESRSQLHTRLVESKPVRLAFNKAHEAYAAFCDVYHAQRAFLSPATRAEEIRNELKRVTNPERLKAIEAELSAVEVGGESVALRARSLLWKSALACIGEVEKLLTLAKVEITKLAAEVQTEEQKFAALFGEAPQRSAASTRIATLQSEIGSLEGRVANLRTLVAGAPTPAALKNLFAWFSPE